MATRPEPVQPLPVMRMLFVVYACGFVVARCLPPFSSDVNEQMEQFVIALCAFLAGYLFSGGGAHFLIQCWLDGREPCTRCATNAFVEAVDTESPK